MKKGGSFYLESIQTLKRSMQKELIISLLNWFLLISLVLLLIFLGQSREKELEIFLSPEAEYANFREKQLLKILSFCLVLA